jgi:putative glutamine amidotransferase
MSEARPVIGIVSALERAQYGVWDQPCALTPWSYVRAIQDGGGLAVLIPPDAGVADDPDSVLDRLDGLMLSGGSDIDPAQYGAPAHPETRGVVPERDALELALVRRAIERDMPVLGICRGMQILNVACGGTLIQHLPDTVGHGEHRRNPGTFDGSEHNVTLSPGSLAAEVAGELSHETRSHHHQAVDVIGEGLVVSGRSDLDELPEAIEAPDREFVLGVQWHPEADPSSGVVRSLVDRAAARRSVAGER